jgi:hypothetical protein
LCTYRRDGTALLVERVDVQENVLEVRIRAERLASLVGKLRQESERKAA